MDSPWIWPPLGEDLGAMRDKKKLLRLYSAGLQAVDAHAPRLQIAHLSSCPLGSLKLPWEVGKMGKLLCPEICGWNVDMHHPPATTQPPQDLLRASLIPGRGLLCNWYRKTVWEVGQRHWEGLLEPAQEHR